MSLLAACSTVWSYATMQLESPELRRLLDAVAKAMTERAGDCNPQELSNTVSDIGLRLMHTHLSWAAEAHLVKSDSPAHPLIRFVSYLDWTLFFCLLPAECRPPRSCCRT